MACRVDLSEEIAVKMITAAIEHHGLRRLFVLTDFEQIGRLTMGWAITGQSEPDTPKSRSIKE